MAVQIAIQQTLQREMREVENPYIQYQNKEKEMLKKDGRSKTRDMEVSPVKGAATRAYETSPAGGNAQKTRGAGKKVSFKHGKIPNK